MFASLADRRTGLCHMDKFAQSLGLVLSEPVEKLFSLFDPQGSGSFTLKDFIKTHFLVVNKVDKEKCLGEVLDCCFRPGSSVRPAEELKLSIQKKFNVVIVEFGNANEFIGKGN
jgi:hypothetical protein